MSEYPQFQRQPPLPSATYARASGRTASRSEPALPRLPDGLFAGADTQDDTQVTSVAELMSRSEHQSHGTVSGGSGHQEYSVASPRSHSNPQIPRRGSARSAIRSGGGRLNGPRHARRLTDTEWTYRHADAVNDASRNTLLEERTGMAPRQSPGMRGGDHPPSSSPRRTAPLSNRRVSSPPSISPFPYQPLLSPLLLPPWQPDADVSACPVCGNQFGFWYRKHHCRKCGRVVCAYCSPHRITIPKEFIVRPPQGSGLIDPDELGLTLNMDLEGGEEVRVCNPCVPDPNMSPPPQLGSGVQASHSGFPSGHYQGQFYGFSTLSPLQASGGPPEQYHFHGSQVGPQPVPPRYSQHHENGLSRRRAQTTTSSPLPPIPTQRMSLPPTWDGPGRGGPGFVPGGQPATGPPELTQHRMSELLAGRSAVYEATEKDCQPLEGEDEKPECSICFEEFEAGMTLARLQCFCRFHERCIADWWNRPGSTMECPTHKRVVY